jgi:hypothetical protein
LKVTSKVKVTITTRVERLQDNTFTELMQENYKKAHVIIKEVFYDYIKGKSGITNNSLYLKRILSDLLMRII